jgi:quinol monooxygenase YgiN
MPIPKHPFGQIATIVTFTIDPRHRSEFIELTMQYCEQCLRDEPHAIQMEVLSQPSDEYSVLLFAIYLDKTAFAEHLKGGAVKRHSSAVKNMIKNANVVQYVIGI